MNALAPTVHPAILAHYAGRSVTYLAGRDYTVFLVTLGPCEWLVTEWADNRPNTVKRV